MMSMSGDVGSDRRRTRRAALALGASSVVLAACGRAPATVNPAPKALEPATLLVLTEGAAVERFGVLAERFSQQHPGVTFEWDRQDGAGFSQKALTLTAAGTPPQLTYATPRNIIAVVDQGAFMDMGDMARKEKIDLHEMVKSTLDDVTWKGTMFLVPVSVSVAMLRYNKTLFQRAGRPDPGQLWAEKKWTWDTFVDTARGLHPRMADGADLPYVAYHQWLTDYELFSVVWSHGGEFLSADKTRLVLDEGAGPEALERWLELAGRHKLTPPAVPLPSGADGDGFHTGHVGMRFMAGHHTITNRTAQKRSGAQMAWDVAPVPSDKQHVPAQQTNGYGIWKVAAHKDHSLALFRHLMADDALVELGEKSGFMPTRPRLWEVTGKRLNVADEDPKSVVKVIQESGNGARGFPLFAGYTAFRDALQKQVLEPAARGDKPVRDALAAAKSVLTAELARR